MIRPILRFVTCQADDRLWYITQINYMYVLTNHYHDTQANTSTPKHSLYI